MLIYCDYNATTPIDPKVLVTMQPWLSDKFGNSSSRDHALGWDASEAIEDSRIAIAKFINATPQEIVFTSGATESLNLAIKGFTGYREWKRKKIITCITEHDAVLAPCKQLQRATGLEVDVLPVDSCGHFDLGQLRESLHSDKSIMVALMAANNEIGTIHPMRQIAEIVHQAGALFLCDITQAVGKMPIDVVADGIDLAVFSAHKIYGPKGVGLLYICSSGHNIELESLIVGGGQEQGRRGGALNVPGIIGFGESCRIVEMEWECEAEHVQRMRDRLEQTLLAELPNIWINGDLSNRIPNTSNIGFQGIDALILIRDIHDIAVSTRAACSSRQTGPSNVLKAIGLTDDEAYSCIRFSLGRYTTEEEIDSIISKVASSVLKLRKQQDL